MFEEGPLLGQLRRKTVSSVGLYELQLLVLLSQEKGEGRLVLLSKDEWLARLVEDRKAVVVQNRSAVVLEDWKEEVVEDWKEEVVQAWKQVVVEEWKEVVVEYMKVVVVEDWKKVVVGMDERIAR